MGTRLHTRASTQARDRSYLDSLVMPTFGGFELRRITPADIQVLGVEARRCRVRGGDGPQGACPAPDDPRRGGGLRLACTVSGSRRQIAADRKTRDAVPHAARNSASCSKPSRAATGCLSRPRRTPAYGSASSPGLRPGDVEPLRKKIITVRRGLVEVSGRLHVEEPKTPASRRTVTIPAWLGEELAFHLRGHDTQYVFTAPREGTAAAVGFPVPRLGARNGAGRPHRRPFP